MSSSAWALPEVLCVLGAACSMPCGRDEYCQSLVTLPRTPASNSSVYKERF